MQRFPRVRMCFVLALLGTAPFAQVQSTQDLLAKALEVVNIRAEGSAAFHLRGTVQFYEKGIPASHGSYDLKWRSPSSWREEIEVGNLRQLRIANADKLWEARTLPYFTPAVEQIEKVMEFPKHIQVLGNDRAGAVREREVDGMRVYCFDVKAGHLDVKSVCLQRDSNFPVRVDYGKQNGGGGFHYEDPIVFGNHRFPRVIQTFDKKPILEFHVDQLTEIGPVETDSFTVPRDARSFGWCPDPTQAEPIENGVVIPPEVASKMGHDRAVVYGIIGADGQWRDLAMVESSGKVSDSVWFNVVRSYRFRPAHCGRTPIEQERLMKFGQE